MKVISRKVKGYRDLLTDRLSSTSTLEKNVVRLKIASTLGRLVKDAIMLWNDISKQVMSQKLSWNEE